jgi:transposase
MEKDVLRIRESAGNFKELAKSFGVSVATIYDIKARRSWDNLEG